MTIPTIIYTANWLTRLPVYFVFSLLFTACQLDDPNEIGKGLNAMTDNVGVVYTDTLTVTTSTVLVDSVPANISNSSMIIGRVNDPALGTIRARHFTQFVYSSRTDLGQNPVYDSTKLFLYVRRDSTQSKAISQLLTFHNLTETIDRNKVYYTTDQVAFASTPAATATYTRAATVTDGVDSLKVPLSAATGQAILSAYVNTLTVDDFLNQFKGLAIQTNQSESQLQTYGQLVSFNGVVYQTRIEVYYHKLGSSTGSSFSIFPVTNGSFNQITFEGAGALSNLKKAYDAVPSTSTNQTTYVLASVGLRTKLEIPTLAKLREKGNILINDARLYVNPQSSTVLSNSLPPPNQLMLYELNPEGRIYRASYSYGSSKLYQNFPLSFPFTTGFATRQLSGKYVGEYVFDLTGYLQQLLYNNEKPVNQRRADKGLLLSVPSQTTDASTGQVYYLGENELTLRGIGLGNQQNPSHPLRLVVYYTHIQ